MPSLEDVGPGDFFAIATHSSGVELYFQRYGWPILPCLAAFVLSAVRPARWAHVLGRLGVALALGGAFFWLCCGVLFYALYFAARMLGPDEDLGSLEFAIIEHTFAWRPRIYDACVAFVWAGWLRSCRPDAFVWSVVRGLRAE